MRIQRLTKDAKENLLEDLLKRSPNNYGRMNREFRKSSLM